MEQTEKGKKCLLKRICQRKYLCVLGGFMVHLVIGGAQIWGNINVYVYSYMYSNYSTSIT